jgi:hypothetical protein
LPLLVEKWPKLQISQPELFFGFYIDAGPSLQILLCSSEHPRQVTKRLQAVK